jgi:hypothetical protein
VREIRTLRAMWRALETGSSQKIYAPALDPTEDAQAETALSRALGIARGNGINRPEAAEVLETYRAVRR